MMNERTTNARRATPRPDPRSSALWMAVAGSLTEDDLIHIAIADPPDAEGHLRSLHRLRSGGSGALSFGWKPREALAPTCWREIRADAQDAAGAHRRRLFATPTLLLCFTDADAYDGVDALVDNLIIAYDSIREAHPHLHPLWDRMLVDLERDTVGCESEVGFIALARGIAACLAPHSDFATAEREFPRARAWAAQAREHCTDAGCVRPWDWIMRTTADDLRIRWWRCHLEASGAACSRAANASDPLPIRRDLRGRAEPA